MSGRPRNPDEFYAEVAEQYVAQVAEGHQRPAAALAQARGVPITTVHGWVKEARRRGRLGGSERAVRAADRAASRRLTAMRTAAGSTRREMAEALTLAGLPISEHVIANYESGRATWALTSAAAIASHFGITLDDLVSGLCGACEGSPPAGFRCLSCGEAAA